MKSGIHEQILLELGRMINITELHILILFWPSPSFEAREVLDSGIFYASKCTQFWIDLGGVWYAVLLI